MEETFSRPHEEGSGGLPPTLLPTKVYGSQPQYNRPFPYPEAPVRWQVGSILEWFESLAQAAEQGEFQNNFHLGNQQHRQPIGGSELPLADPVPLPPWYTQPVSNDEAVIDETSCNAVTPKNWDLSFVEHQDPWGWSDRQRMAKVACQVEASSSVNCEKYHGIRTRFEFLFGRCVFQHSTPVEHGQRRMILRVLYEETTAKLRELLGNHQPPLHQIPDKILSESSPIATKQDLSKYMTAWLRENWTNPYPDDQGLATMAQACHTTPTVVNNWLINARTRKWRRAITKATNMHRPAKLLLEDSLRIFDGEEVRELGNLTMEISSSCSEANDMEGPMHKRHKSGM
jgi:hypothetical protein